jgi:protoheme IX farnesyltransferase
MKEQSYTEARALPRWREKLSLWSELMKLRLSMLVALSAMFGYAMAAGDYFTPWHLLLMGLAGLLITGASNALNQVFEREYDKIMQRTAQRPLPTGRATVQESVLLAILLFIAGVGILGYYFNVVAALLGIIGLLSYAFVYTPMKRISPFSVLVGAIPGALPPLIGWAGYSGMLDFGGWVLFAFQFFWQFPHFWAIAWRLDEDYRKAGFKMMPLESGRSRGTALMMLVYTLALSPLTFFAFKAGFLTPWGAAALALLGLLFALPSLLLYRSLDNRHATQVLFGSFLYLPASQLIFLIA